MSSCSSVEEVLSESSNFYIHQLTPPTSSQLLLGAVSTGDGDDLLKYDSDTFDSTSCSVTSTVDDKLNCSQITTSSSHHSLSHQSPPKENVGVNINLVDEKCEARQRVAINKAGEDKQTATRHSVDGEIFLSQKLDILKLLTAEKDRTKATDLPTQNSTSDSDRTFNQEEAAFIEAALVRLRSKHGEERSSVGWRTRSKLKSDDVAFVRQCEKLKIESLQHKMRTEINRLDEETKEHYRAVECSDQQRDIAKNKFVNHRLKLLTQSDFQEKLDRHLYERDSLTLLGEIVGTSVRPSAPSEQVWKALADKMLLLQKKHQTHQD